VRSRNLDIPPGERRYHVTAQSDPLPVDVRVIGIAPHMHYIGKEMKVVARSPDGQTVPLIWIKDRDFYWQGQYQYRTPVELAKGSIIQLEAYYDNSEDNPANPSRPPKRVGWGEQTTDEMCLLGVQVVTENLADLRKIVAMRGNRPGAVLVGGGGAGDRAGTLARPGARTGTETAPVPIPERFKDALGRYDQDGDGKLSGKEIDAMPQGLAQRIRQAIRRRSGDDQDKP
jgi:Copper type II ascorbate-dependent monooxygenase, C-terminal domain